MVKGQKNLTGEGFLRRKFQTFIYIDLMGYVAVPRRSSNYRARPKNRVSGKSVVDCTSKFNNW